MSDQTEYRDRCHGYVPTWLTDDGPHVRYHALIGDPQAGPLAATRVPVAEGLADELNRKHHGSWSWAQIYPGSSDEPEHWSHFEGHEVRIGVLLRSWNERVFNDWKGRDEVRKSGGWRLYFNDQVVYGGYDQDPLEALLVIRNKAKALLGGHVQVNWMEDDYRGQIEGRRVYYSGQPAVLEHWMPEQGCVMAVAAEGTKFRPAAWAIDDGSPEDDEFTKSAKIALDDPAIWWWRRRNGD